MDIEKLKALALAATPGPWLHRHDPGNPVGVQHGVRLSGEFGAWVCDCLDNADRSTDGGVAGERNAAFIAAANPAAVLELLAEVERLRAELASRCRAEDGDTRTAPWYIAATKMANAHFNLSQYDKLPAHWRKTCREMVDEWDESRKDISAAPAAGTVNDAELADALNTTLWLYRRLPHAYGKPPFVDKAILTMAARLGMDDVPAAIKERAAIEAHTKAGSAS